MNKIKRLKEVDGAIWFIIFLYIGLFSIAFSLVKLGIWDQNMNNNEPCAMKDYFNRTRIETNSSFYLLYALKGLGRVDI